ncbi:MAG: hydrolase Nlp/P60 [Hungatella sp.]|nr:hydrolase Nlp/P60 [Hungatella sp.]
MEKRQKKLRDRIVRAGILVLTGVMLWRTPFPSFATSQAKKEKQEAERKRDQANRRADEAQQKIEQAEAEVTSLSNELSALIADISLLEMDIEYKNEQIHQAQGEYDAAKVKEESQYEAMKKRIKYMYERGDTEYLEILLQVKSMTELLNKSEYIEALYTYDRKKLTEFQETKEQVKQYKAQLENEKAEMEGMQIEYQEQQAHLENTISKKRVEIANFDEQLESAREEAAAYTAAIARKTEQIRQAEAEAKRKAEAERLAREQEAARAAEAQRQSEEAARLAAAQTSENAVNAPDVTDVNPGGFSHTQTAAAPTMAAAGNPEEPERTTSQADGPKAETTMASGGGPSEAKAPSKGSAKGQSVADYAMNFIGNPYVFGGTSLTNGADCSGFVQSVYKNFGVTLPRSSTDQRSAGTGVSYTEAQPGDIICYAGHVGIYIGNNQIVHASSPTTGIKVGNATYRSILSVRRIFN